MKRETTKTFFIKRLQHPSVPSPSESPLVGLVAVDRAENTNVMKHEKDKTMHIIRSTK
jgi:hypothetical protein